MPLIYLPVFLSLTGLFLGPQLALRLNNCPHRGRVWGAFSLPLVAMIYSPILPFAIAMSFCAAVASGLTAHKAFKVSLAAVGTCGLLMTILLGLVLRG